MKGKIKDFSQSAMIAKTDYPIILPLKKQACQINTPSPNRTGPSGQGMNHFNANKTTTTMMENNKPTITPGDWIQSTGGAFDKPTVKADLGNGNYIIVADCSLDAYKIAAQVMDDAPFTVKELLEWEEMNARLIARASEALRMLETLEKCITNNYGHLERYAIAGHLEDLRDLIKRMS